VLDADVVFSRAMHELLGRIATELRLLTLTLTTTRREPRTTPEPESPEAAAERERRYREILGIPEPKPRRGWRR
jgi:hypothetical protein